MAFMMEISRLEALRRRDPWRPHRVGDGRRRRESGVQGPSRRAGDGSAASATDPAGKEGEACGLHRTGSRRGSPRCRWWPLRLPDARYSPTERAGVPCIAKAPTIALTRKTHRIVTTKIGRAHV